VEDSNFPSVVKEDGVDYGYRIQIRNSEEEIIGKLRELKTAIESHALNSWEFRGMKALFFGRHLYQPLLSLESGTIEIAPAPLNKGEQTFIEDLITYYDAHEEFFATRELYLLRNLSKGRGMGFFEAGNFHPDFILWQLIAGRQHVSFVDPKGLRHIGLNDPKINFYKTVKEIEQRLGDPNVQLDSFIISNTPSNVLSKLWSVEKSYMHNLHILFQDEDRDRYIGALLQQNDTVTVNNK
jgi:hypothetical protein